MEAPLVGFAEALDYLRAEQGELDSEADQDRLQWMCQAATAVVARDLGRVLVSRTVTETLDGGRHTVRLSSTPVAEITEVTESGSVVDASGYMLRTSPLGGSMSGKLYRGTTTAAQSWLPGWQNVEVTYVAGLAAIDSPAAEEATWVVRKIVLSTIQGMWQATQQADPLLVEAREASMFAATGALTPGERSAYNSLRAVTGFA